VDADDFHSSENVSRMRRGESLDDAARAAWLNELRERIDRAYAQGETIVLACSALESSYRGRLGLPRPGAALVYLHVSPEVARARVAARAEHFMPATLVASQFEALEEPAEPAETIIVEADQPLRAITRAISQRLGLI